VDARNGVIEQTKRHSYIASLLGIPHLVICVNKMDLVDYSEGRYEEIVDSYKRFASKMDINDIQFVPISALKGDNIVNRSEQMTWYNGPTLMYLFENIHIASDYNVIDARFPIQYVIRPQDVEGYRDYRGYSGRVVSGVFRTGERIVVLPSGFESIVKSIHEYDQPVEEAHPPMSVSLELENNIDISRGDMIAKPNNQPATSQDIDAMICWFSEKPLQVGGKYALKHTSAEVRAMIKDVIYKMDINELSRMENEKHIVMNDICRVQLRTTRPLLFDPYKQNRTTGSFILIDEATNNTVAAGMIRG